MSESENHAEAEQEAVQRVLGLTDADSRMIDAWKENKEDMSARSLDDLRHAVEGELRKRKGW